MVIGDWGGVRYTDEMPIMPADHRSHLFPKRMRSFVHGVDDYAQPLGITDLLSLAKATRGRADDQQVRVLRTGLCA